MNVYKVLLACLDNWNTAVEIPYIFKKSGCDVHILCKKNAWLKSNRYHDKWLESSTDEATYLQQLFDIARADIYDWIILCDEPLIKLVNENVEEALFTKLLPLTKIENRNVLTSKAGLSVLCEKYAILSPKYVVYNNKLGASGITECFKYPVILKPDFSWGGVGFTICNDWLSLIEQLDGLSVKGNIIIQEYIKGKEVPVEALFGKGKLMTYAVSEILAHDKGEFSYSTRRKYFANEKIGAELEKIGMLFGFNGFVNLAFIQNAEDGEYYLIEADTRPNSWMAYGRFAGCDFSDGIRMITGLPPNPRVKKLGRENVEIALFHKDIRRCIYKREYKSLFQWLYNYKGYWRYIPFYDSILMKKLLKDFYKEFVKKDYS